MRLQKNSAGKVQVFDLVRKKYVAFTPEEEVRQSLIVYLNESLHIPIASMTVEKSFTLYGKEHRPDLIVYNKKAQAVLLVECKAPHIPITMVTQEQIARYQLIKKVPYWILTNGKECHAYQIDLHTSEIRTLHSLPDWNQLNIE
ncbi:MAG: type I restriction enzyme HsdR N-terminal domain-containing protein [Bacteroidales bacterium]